MLAQQVAAQGPDHLTALFSRQLFRNDTNKGVVSVLLLQVSAPYLPQWGLRMCMGSRFPLDFHFRSFHFALLLAKFTTQFKLENVPSQTKCTTHHYSIILTWQENLLPLDSSLWRTYFYWISMQKKRKKKRKLRHLTKSRVRTNHSRSQVWITPGTQVCTSSTKNHHNLSFFKNLLIYNILYRRILSTIWLILQQKSPICLLIRSCGSSLVQVIGGWYSETWS